MVKGNNASAKTKTSEKKKMDNVVTVKPGVLFTVIAPGGFRILEAVTSVARGVGLDLCITSACDGTHSGPNDPHHRGEAYDVRSHDFTAPQKATILAALETQLALEQFYFFLESPGTDNEHFHIQVKKGTTYP
jgi:hypothetical protein